MKKIGIVLCFSALLAGLFACKSVSTSTAAYYASEPECLGIERDGSQTLRVAATGRNKSDAVEQAKKDAVWAVLFKGIRSGNGGCNAKPLITEVNAGEKYQYYFNTFFKDNGEYKNYISMEDSRTNTTTAVTRDVQEKWYVTVRVLRPELQQKLIQDGILKP